MILKTMADIENTNNSTKQLFLGIEKLLNHTKQQVSIYVNDTLNNLNWYIGNYIISEIKSLLSDKICIFAHEFDFELQSQN